jgi:hypothetical protein
MHPEGADRQQPMIVRGFRYRGHRDVSRIESFSDAVFGFSITLLVVSLQVPRTFDELLHTLAGFPAFAVTFALLAEIWYVQYRFFRRYALQDGTTILLNVVLLFVIVFFTYPLKFLFGLAVGVNGGGHVIRGDQIATMYAVYGIGYAAIFVIFFLLHALRRGRDARAPPPSSARSSSWACSRSSFWARSASCARANSTAYSRASKI